jgi:hypothetical protein
VLFFSSFDDLATDMTNQSKLCETEQCQPVVIEPLSLQSHFDYSHLGDQTQSISNRVSGGGVLSKSLENENIGDNDMFLNREQIAKSTVTSGNYKYSSLMNNFVPVARRKKTREEFTMEIEIGKFTLESLTTGMYNEPEACYREYIQNAVDSCDTALAEGIMQEEDFRIEIIVDGLRQEISIRDNGTSIKKDLVRKTLLDIGNSTKLHTTNSSAEKEQVAAGLAATRRDLYAIPKNAPVEVVVQKTALMERLTSLVGEVDESTNFKVKKDIPSNFSKAEKKV